MSKEIRSICIYGVGGVGGYFGGKIANEINQKKRDMEVYFIGRGEHLRKIQEKGLKLVTDDKTIHCFPNIATNNIRLIPKPDLYLLCVKGYDLENALKEISKNITSNTIVLPLLNGVDIYERIKVTMKKGIILAACVYIFSSLEKPGIVRQKGSEGRIVFGGDPQFTESGNDYQNIVAFFQKVGIKAEYNENPSLAIWEKYIFVAPFSLVTAFYQKTIGEILEDEKLTEIVARIINEIALIGKAKGIPFNQNIVERTLQIARLVPYESKTSFQRDIEGKNKGNEGDIFGGTLVRMAEDYQIPVPCIQEIYHKLIK